MQARYYDPVIGRFYSNDPVGFRDVHSFNRYAYANNNPYKYIDPDGQLSVSANTTKRYPKAAAYIKSKTIASKAKYAAFAKYGQASKSAVDKAFTPGSGPVVVGKELDGANGTFQPNSNSNKLNINNELLANFENGADGAQTLLDSTIEHEATHYFDDQDGVDYPGEEGQAFEEAVYGSDIDNLKDAKEYEDKKKDD